MQVCLIGLPLALGGAHPETNIAFACCALVALGITLYRGRLEWHPAPTAWLGLALLTILVQWLPLPDGLLRVLAPEASQIWKYSQAAGHITTDLAATSHELFKFCGYFVASWLTLSIFDSKQSLFQTIAISGLILGLLGLVHLAFGWTDPYGTIARRPQLFTTPFINPNHGAGFLGLTSLLAVGLGITHKTKQRAFYLATAALCGGGVLLTLSRGATLAYLSTLGGLMIVLALRAKITRHPQWISMGAMAGSLAVAILLGYRPIVHELWTLSETNAFSKMTLWGDAPTLLDASGPMGVGRGAFTGMFFRHKTIAAELTFSHLENEWLQTLVDFGPYCGAILLLAVVAMWLSALLSAKDPLDLAGVAALLFLGIHNLADFNLEVSAIALPAVMILTRLCPVAGRRSFQVPRKFHMGAWLISAALIAGLAPLALQESVDDEAKRMQQILKNGAPWSDRMVDAEPVLARHMGHFFLPLLIAKQAFREKDIATAQTWAERARTLNPKSPRVHLLQAALWEDSEPKLASGAYVQALQYDPSQAAAIFRSMLQKSQPLSSLKQILFNLPGTKMALLQELHRRQDFRSVLALTQGSLDLVDLERRFYAHKGLGEQDRALAIAQALREQAPSEHLGYTTAVEILLGQHRAELAWALLQQARSHGVREFDLLLWETRVLLEQKRHDAALLTARKILPRIPPGSKRAEVLFLVGTIERERGERLDALKHLSQACSHAPTYVPYWLERARLQMELGYFQQGLRDLQEAPKEILATADVRTMKATLLAQQHQTEQALRFEYLAQPE
jgi:tetratricopeptide (TPR) repeat protein